MKIMEILKKEFNKYVKPKFFNIGRMFVYVLAILMLLGVNNTTEVSEPIFIHFYFMCFIALTALIYDIINGVKKMKTYKDHRVQFLD